MIVAIEKSTNRIIVSSSFSDIETELNNAINSGFTNEEIEVKEVTDEEYQVILENQPEGILQPTAQDLQKQIFDLTTQLVIGGII